MTLFTDYASANPLFQEPSTSSTDGEKKADAADESDKKDTEEEVKLSTNTPNGNIKTAAAAALAVAAVKAKVRTSDVFMHRGIPYTSFPTFSYFFTQFS